MKTDHIQCLSNCHRHTGNSLEHKNILCHVHGHIAVPENTDIFLAKIFLMLHDRIALAAIFSRSFRELQFTDIPRYCRLCHMISGLFQILRKLLLRLNLIFSDQLHDLTVSVNLHVCCPFLISSCISVQFTSFEVIRTPPCVSCSAIPL